MKSKFLHHILEAVLVFSEHIWESYKLKAYTNFDVVI